MLFPYTTLFRSPFRSRNRCLARFLAVSLCLQTRLVVGHSRTRLVVAGAGWNSVLCSKAQACFMERLQTLARVALKPSRDGPVMSTTADSSCGELSPSTLL